MKFKAIEQAKENWTNLKEQQQAYVFQAIWFGKLVPGMTSKEQAQAKGLIAGIKKRIGKFPGLLYEEAYSQIDAYRLDSSTKEELIKTLTKFYPTQSRIGLRLTLEEIELNKQMQNKIQRLGIKELDEILEDLKKSESRDKQKVLNSIK